MSATSVIRIVRSEGGVPATTAVGVLPHWMRRYAMGNLKYTSYVRELV
jgi:hypothetical protein